MTTRIPPNLLYLTIYNPTLKPNDEDAEEQAHILFYTSKERAVSRDRMLRQVGLAKALISFSDMFNAEDPCNNVHSQAKRMIMVSPEPDFWIHAGIEVAKTPRQPADKSKGKAKEKAKADQPLLYEYHEHSVHDAAIQADILRGYESFKLKHGSFASILSSLGQEALELQLERFFTVWAWSWNLEDGPELEIIWVCPPLHPMQGSLLSHIDEFSSRLPDEVIAIAISPPHIIPSTRYTQLSYPSALPTLLLSFLPPPRAPQLPRSTTDDGTLKAGHRQISSPSRAPNRVQLRKSASDEGNKTFLGMNLDAKPPELLAVTPLVENKGDPNVAKMRLGPRSPPLDTDTPRSENMLNFEVDRSALEDAMHSERLPLPPPPIEKTASGDDDGRSLEGEEPDAASVDDIDSSSPLEASPAVVEERELPPTPEPDPEPPAEFSSTTVHLATAQDPQAIRRRRLFYLVRNLVLVALIDLNDDTPLDAAALAVTIAACIEEEPSKSFQHRALPSATKILQPQDRYALTAAQTLGPQQLLQASDPSIKEVFSRGQNPQHWHVARRGVLGPADEDGADGQEEV
ncbi:hypothetical protein R3P38DRAFT_2952176 [Favolaschia claudopus]|uniref:CCZ1/INTU/HSP4 first Longin domain-containing protein n=1 Tax=Favolaschia claudopus TaxID=2862362 RepID=A0AAW0BG26_9AGAR